MTDQPLAHLPPAPEGGEQPRVVPSLLSTDLERTAEFYTGLGFAPLWLDGGGRLSRFLVVSRDGIYITFFNEPLGSMQQPSLSGMIYTFPNSVDALAEEWRGKVEFLWGPDLMPYGIYEFAIADPDGYCVAFAERRSPVS